MAEQFELILEDDKAIESLTQLGDLAREPDNRTPLAKWVPKIASFLPSATSAKSKALCYRALANIVIDLDENRKMVYDNKIPLILNDDFAKAEIVSDEFFQRNVCGFVGNCIAGSVSELNVQLAKMTSLQNFLLDVFVSSHNNKNYFNAHLCAHAIITFFDEEFLRNNETNKFYIPFFRTLIPTLLPKFINSNQEEDFSDQLLSEDIKILEYLSFSNREMLFDNKGFFDPLFDIAFHPSEFPEETEEDDEMDADEEISPASACADFLKDFYCNQQLFDSPKFIKFPEFHFDYAKKILVILKNVISDEHTFIIKRDVALAYVLNLITKKCEEKELLQELVSFGFTLLNIHLPSSEEVRAKLKMFKYIKGQLRVKNEEKYKMELQTLGAKLLHSALAKSSDFNENIVSELLNSKENKILEKIDEMLGNDGTKSAQNQPLMLSLSSVMRDLINSSTIPILLNWGILDKLQGYVLNSNPVIIYDAIMAIRVMLAKDTTTDTVCTICSKPDLLISLLQVASGAKRAIVKKEGYEAKVENENEEEKPAQESSKRIQYVKDFAGILEIMNDSKPDVQVRKDFRVLWEAGRIVSKIVLTICELNELSEKQKASFDLINSSISFVLRSLLTLATSPFEVLIAESNNGIAALNKKIDNLKAKLDIDDDEKLFVIESVKSYDKAKSILELLN